MRRSALAAPLLAMLACSGPAQTARPQRRYARRELRSEWLVRVLGLESRRRTDSTWLEPVAFRAGGGLVALLQARPTATYQFMLAVPKAPAWTEEMRGFGGNPSLGAPGDLVNVTRDGVTWYLDTLRHRIVGQDVGNLRHPIGVAPSGPVHSACAVTDSLLVFIRRDREGALFWYDHLGEEVRGSARVPAGLLVPRGSTWAEFRLSGSRTGACVLHAPRAPGVVAVTPDGLGPLVRFVEPTSKARTWVDRLLGREGVQGPGAVDATPIADAIAVLFAGQSDSAGRLVDYYSPRGVYLGTSVLPWRPRRIAGSDHRLYGVGELADSAVLASWVLPYDLRPKARADTSPVFVPAPR